MKKYLVVVICLVVLIAFSGLIAHAKDTTKTDINSLSAKVDALSNEVASLNGKLDQILANQAQFSEELKRVKVLIRRS